MSKKIPSPCIDVCKFKLQGRCLGCTMTKKQKKTFGKLDGTKKKRAFIADLTKQQQSLGRHDYWLKQYLKKCARKGIKPPLPI